MVRRELLVATSTFFTCGFLHQTGAQYSAAGNARACVEIRSVLAEAPQVVPARRRMSETIDVTFPATSSRCCLKFGIRSRFTPRYFWSMLRQAFVIHKYLQFPFRFSVIEMVGDRNCIVYTKVKTTFAMVVYQDSHAFILEWTTSLDSTSGTLICPSVHVTLDVIISYHCSGG